MGDGNWLKLYRATLDNPIVTKDADHLAIWIYLLCEAAFYEHDTVFNGNRITLKLGQVPTGRKKIAEKLGVSESKVQRVLKSFENEHQIEQQTTSTGRLISIVNWGKYQSCEQQIEQRVNSDRTTSEQRVNTTKERKERKEVKEDIYSDVPEEIKDAFMDWIQMRKDKKKPIRTKRAVTMALNKLNALTKNPEKQRELIDYAIYRNWESFYPIPDADKIPKPKVEEKNPEQEIDAVPMPDETRDKLNALGMGNVIGKG